MGKDLISIIIPVYNNDECIDKCIQSVICQTYTKWILYIIDDGSTDNTPKICDIYENTDERIHVFHIKNGGVSNARNLGISKVKTKYFVFIDSDDYIEPTYLEKFLEAKKLYPNAGHIWCCFKTISFEKREELHDYIIKNDNEFVMFNRNQLMTLFEDWMVQMIWHKLYDTEVVKKFNLSMDTSLDLGEDILFNFDYINAVNSEQIVIVNKPLYNYVIGKSESLDNKFRDNLLEINMKIHAKMWDYISLWKLPEEQKQIFYNVVFYSYEKILSNTWNKNNLMSKKEKYRFNNKILKSDSFKKILKKQNCHIFVPYYLAYKSGNYFYVKIVNYLIRLKHKLIN